MANEFSSLSVSGLGLAAPVFGPVRFAGCVDCGAANLATKNSCRGLDRNLLSDGQDSFQVMVPGHGVIETDACAAVVTDPHRWCRSIV
jgi:hypothetical protein